MAFLLCLLEVVLLTILSLDTLGFLVAYKKNSSNVTLADYRRLSFTWVFFFALRAVSMSDSTGYIANFVQMLTLLAKAFITFPLLGGTEKLYRLVVEENFIAQTLKSYVTLFQQKLAGEDKPKTS